LYIHGTTAIEGNTLTLRETHYLLNEEIVPKEKFLREINEVQNFKYVKAYLEKYKGKVDLKFIRE
jgi:Fic family protein